MGMAVRDALLGALLTAAVSQLAFGVVNALSFLLAPALFARFPEDMGRVFPVAGEALAPSLLWRFPVRPFFGRTDFLLPPLAAIAAAGLCLTGSVYRAASFGRAEGSLLWLHGEFWRPACCTPPAACGMIVSNLEKYQRMLFSCGSRRRRKAANPTAAEFVRKP